VRTSVVIAAICLAVVAEGAAAERDARIANAAKRKDLAAIGTLVKLRADVNGVLPDGATALHWAVYWDDQATVDLLLNAGANPNAVNELGVSPLSLACINRSDRVVERLLAGRADPNLAQPTGEVPLMTCARSGNAAAVKALVSRGAQINVRDQERSQTALMWAVAARHADVVRLLVELGADVNARSAVTNELLYVGGRYVTSPPANPAGIVVEAKQGGFTPLLFAAQQDDLESAKVLLDAGASANDADAGGTSALVLAAHSASGRVAALLLEHGADPNAAGSGYSALHAAVLRGDVSLVKDLLKRGGDPNARLTRGTPVRKYSLDYALSVAWVGATPYWLAAKFAEPEMMRALAAAGADTRLALAEGTTPLMAAMMGPQGTGDRRDRFQNEAELKLKAPGEEAKISLGTVALALELGADVNTTNKAGDAAVHTATARALPEVIELLAQHGADLNARNGRGLTPLAIATANRRGIDFFADASGPAPVSNQTSPTAEMLRKLGAKVELAKSETDAR
jgi:ankyrin repeat protein